MLGLVVAYNPEYVQESWHLVLMCESSRPESGEFARADDVLPNDRPRNAPRLLLLQCTQLSLGSTGGPNTDSLVLPS